MEDDSQLLRSFAENRSETAFAELVRRKAGLVYSAARRQVDGDTLLAQDVAQSVFIDLARKARGLAKRPVLTSWLYQSTRYAALNAVRAERRRRRREEEAQRMNDTAHEPAADEAWTRLRPVIDAEMAALGERDRAAILLRYFEGSSYAEMAARLGAGENAVRMRVDRALEKLQARLLRRGIGSTAAALALALSSQAVAAPPAGLPAALAGAALAKSAAAGGGAGLLIKLLQISAMKKLQLGIAAFGAALGSGLAYRETAAGIHSPAFTVYSICFGTGLLFALVSVIAGHLGDLHGELGHATAKSS